MYQSSFIRNGNITFSQREMEIMEMICKEKTNKEIAHALHLSIRTIEWYKEQLLQKTNSRSTVGIVLFAIKLGIVKI